MTVKIGLMEIHRRGAVRFNVPLVGAGFVLISFIGLLAYLALIPPSLEGGTRLRYELDFEEALRLGWITREEHSRPAELTSSTLEFIRNRVDPLGRTAIFKRARVHVVQVDSTHFAVEFASLDEPRRSEEIAGVRALIEHTGTLEVYMAARDEATFTEAIRIAEEERVRGWIRDHPGVSLAIFNSLEFEKGGPRENLRWFSRRVGEVVGVPAAVSVDEPLVPLIQQEGRDRYTDKDLMHVGISTDSFGLPAVLLVLTEARGVEFASFTQARIGQSLAVVLDTEIVTLATIGSELKGEMLLTGGAKGYRVREVNRFVKLLRSGPLRVKPKFLGEEVIAESAGK